MFFLFRDSSRCLIHVLPISQSEECRDYASPPLSIIERVMESKIFTVNQGTQNTGEKSRRSTEFDLRTKFAGIFWSTFWDGRWHRIFHRTIPVAVPSKSPPTTALLILRALRLISLAWSLGRGQKLQPIANRHLQNLRKTPWWTPRAPGHNDTTWVSVWKCDEPEVILEKQNTEQKIETSPVAPVSNTSLD